jgi:hypothetical protein
MTVVGAVGITRVAIIFLLGFSSMSIERRDATCAIFHPFIPTRFESSAESKEAIEKAKSDKAQEKHSAQQTSIKSQLTY